MLPGFTPIRDYHDDSPVGTLATLLIDIEAEHHTGGWDTRPPTLYTLCWDAPDVVVTSAPLPDGAPRSLLQTIAQSLATTRGWAAGRPLLYPGAPLAHAVVTETWLRISPHADPAEQARQRAGRSLADMPGSVEGRTALLTTTKDEIVLNRIRGHDPQIGISRPGADTPSFAGGVVDALRLVHAAGTAGWLTDHNPNKEPSAP